MQRWGKTSVMAEQTCARMAQRAQQYQAPASALLPTPGKVGRLPGKRRNPNSERLTVLVKKQTRKTAQRLGEDLGPAGICRHWSKCCCRSLCSNTAIPFILNPAMQPRHTDSTREQAMAVYARYCRLRSKWDECQEREAALACGLLNRMQASGRSQSLRSAESGVQGGNAGSARFMQQTQVMERNA
jgi:hypothetical protein